MDAASTNVVCASTSATSQGPELRAREQARSLLQAAQPMIPTSRRARRAALVSLLVWSSVAGVSGAAAQTPDAEQRAETLFREGREAARRGDDAGGCAKFEESLVLLERASTLLNLAACKEKLGKLGAATAHWQKGLELLPADDDRIAMAKERVASLEKRIPRLVVRLDPSAPPGSKVILDGAELAASALGEAQAIDPGEHVLVVSAPGRLEQKSSIRLAESERRELVVVPGAARPSGDAGGPSKSGSAPPAAAAGDTRRTIGFVVGGVGLASLVGAGITGALVMANDSTIDAECPDARCSQPGFDTVEGSRTLLVVNAITAGVGVVGLGVGAVLVLTSSRGPESAPRVALGPTIAPGAGGISLRGAF